MRALIQRVSQAGVRVEGQLLGRIERGILLFLGVGQGDTHQEVRELAEKVVHLRIFENELGRFDRSLMDIQGAVLVISQFTLYGDCRKGRRPSFTQAATPEMASELYSLFIQELERRGLAVASGRFGEHMEVELINDGPVTLWLEVVTKS